MRRQAEFRDIPPTSIWLLTIRPDFSRAVYQTLGGAIARQSGVDVRPVVETVKQTGKFIQDVLGRLQHAPAGATEGLEGFNRDEQAVATALFVNRVYGKELDVDSNLYKLTNDIKYAAWYRHDVYFWANKDRVGSTDDQLNRIACFVMGLDKGPSDESPWSTYKVEYHPVSVPSAGRVVQVNEKHLISGGLVTPEQWRAQGKQTERQFHPWIARQNFLAEQPDLGQESRRLINTYHQWL